MALGNKTLEDLIAPISARLGRSYVPDGIEVPQYKATPVRCTDGLTQGQLVDMFADEASKVRVQVHRCPRAQVADAVGEIVAEGGSKVAADDGRLRELGVIDALGGELTIWDPAHAQESIDATRTARFGVSYAAAGIAETGTVLQPSSAECGRSVSLLPLAHIALVDASSIVATMADALRPYEEDGAKPPAQLCFISGPSATADIELVRVEGVHGPMYVHYVIVE